MKNRRAIIILAFLFITREAAHADPDRPRNNSQAAATKENYGAAITPILPSDVPEIGMAAFKGDTDTLSRLISLGKDIESAGTDKRTPLLLASAGGHPEAVVILLKAGAKINARDASGGTALHWAAQRGDDEIIRVLLAYRPDVNIQDEFGETPLVFAAIAGNLTIVQALITAGANRDLTDDQGLTASDWAKRGKKNASIVSLLESRKK